MHYALNAFKSGCIVAKLPVGSDSNRGDGQW